MIARFQKFILEFKENEKNTPTLYKDDNIEIKVAKTLDSAKKQNKNTHWCSSSKEGFYGHDKTANMYRFNFSDGYKLRLTWDYITKDASELGSYSGGTHWGQGGVLNGERMNYIVLRPEDESEPFLFDYNKEDSRKLMVDRIESIPQEAIDKIHKYQNQHTKEKSEKITKSYNDIQNIKIKSITDDYRSETYNRFKVIVDYKGDNKELEFRAYKEERYLSVDTWNFRGSLKNAYMSVGKTLDKYLIDKISEFCKKHGIKTYE